MDSMWDIRSEVNGFPNPLLDVEPLLITRLGEGRRFENRQSGFRRGQENHNGALDGLKGNTLSVLNRQTLFVTLYTRRFVDQVDRESSSRVKCRCA